MLWNLKVFFYPVISKHELLMLIFMIADEFEIMVLSSCEYLYELLLLFFFFQNLMYEFDDIYVTVREKFLWEVDASSTGFRLIGFWLAWTRFFMGKRNGRSRKAFKFASSTAFCFVYIYTVAIVVDESLCLIMLELYASDFSSLDKTTTTTVRLWK